jgi:hypothetical protein
MEISGGVFCHSFNEFLGGWIVCLNQLIAVSTQQQALKVLANPAIDY